MDDLRLKIVTPNKVFFDDIIERLVARSISGDFAILKNHTPYVTVLEIRDIKIRQNGKYRKAAIAGGYLSVKDNQVTIMTDACEWADEIDLERAKDLKARAEAYLKNPKSQDDTLKAEIALKKAINRINIHDEK
ncbi:ATP synthase F1 subunit epsilon [Peptoniphilaceae bacterium SGI.131]